MPEFLKDLLSSDGFMLHGHGYLWRPALVWLVKLVPQAFAVPAPQQLARARDELQRANDALERRVQERTAEIVRKNQELASEIAERKRAEQALRIAKDAAEAAYAELESFSYSVAHDLRAPLRAMSGYSGTLLEDHASTLDADGRDHLARIDAAALRMGEIIDALLSLARLSRTRPRGRRRHPCLLRPRQRRRLRHGPRRQAVRTVQASPHHRVRRHRHRPRHRPAHRPPPRRPDLGRGRRGPRRHLPLHPAARRTAAPHPPRLHTMILLVEDNPDDEILTLRALKKHRVSNDVVVARTGEDALAFLFGTGPHTGRDLAVRPQVVLLDLNLPRLDGLGVLRQIRSDERTRLQPVVVLTSSKEDEDVLRSYALGANSFVRKPVGFAEFSDAIRTLGLFWMLTNEMPPLVR